MSNEGEPNKRLLMRDAVRRKIITEIIHSVSFDPTTKQRNLRKFAMILDRRSSRIVSSCLQTQDLAEEGVVITENLAKSRQPFLSLDAIYIVEPTPQNLNLMHQDFYLNPEFPKYRSAHVFLIRKPDLHLIELFVAKFQAEPIPQLVEPSKNKRGKKNKNPFQFEPLPSRLVTLMEINLDFLAQEDHLFHLDLPKATVQLFANQVESELCQDAIASGLASVCTTLNEFPFIRYSTDFPLSEQVARRLNSRIENVLQEDDKFWFHGDSNNQPQDRATILFLDRRSDLASCFLHEFTYQALVFDLMHSRDSLVEFGSEKRKATLNESDKLWLEFRHEHVQVVVERLTSMVKELSQTSVARYQKNSDSVSLEEMGKVIKDLPVFKEVMARHTLHMALCQQVMDLVSRQNLIATSNLEQIVVTGVDSMGDRVSETRILGELAALMRRKEVDPKDKLRLACLHAVTLGQVSKDNVAKFIRDSDPPMPIEAQNALLGLSNLGISILNAAGGAEKPPAESSSWFGGWGASLEKTTAYRHPDRLAQAKQVANALKVTSGVRPLRFTPFIHDTCQQLVSGQLSLEAYPFVRPPPPSAAESHVAVRVATLDRSLSVRTRFPDGAVAAGILSSASATKDPHASKYQGGRVIVFVSGGVTYGEIRSLQQIMKITGREIIVGSTHIIKSRELIDHLQIMGGGQERQFLVQEVDYDKEAKEFFGITDEQVLEQMEDDNALGNIPDLAGVEEEQGGLGFIPRIVSCIPLVGKPVARWLNGDDDDDELAVAAQQAEAKH